MIEAQRRPSVQDIYFHLRRRLGPHEAEALMDSLEGHPDLYAELVDSIVSGDFDRTLSPDQ